MDRLETYRTLIKCILTTYADLVAQQPTPGVETVLLCDEDHDHYLWCQVGWTQRVYGVTVHARLHDGTIQIEQDWTEDGIATDLLQAGVPAADIVLAFPSTALSRCSGDGCGMRLCDQP